MKHLFSLLACFAVLQLQAQTANQTAQKLVSNFAHFWSDPSNWERLNQGRSGLDLTHKLDSVVTKNNVFATTVKNEMEYNSLGYTTRINQYGIDSATFLLRLEGITTFDYEIPGYPSHINSEGINPETNQLETQLEMDIEYDGSNRLDSVVISIEDPLFGGGFGPFIGIQQVYSGDLLVQSRQWLFIALLGGWIPASITDMQYDGEGRLTDQLTSSLDFGTGELVPSERTIISYNAQGSKETETDYTWVDPAWEPTQRFNYTYHANGTISDEKRQIYNTTTQAWDDNVWTRYPIENVTDQYPSSSYYWDPVASQWYVTDSLVNLLNPSLKWGQVAVPSQLGLLSLLGGGTALNPFGEPDGSVTQESRYFLSDSLSLDLRFESEDFYYYSLFEGSGVNPVLPEFITIAPNPAQAQFTINLDTDANATYTIYSNTGVAEMKGYIHSGSNIIQAARLAPGLHYVLITMPDGKVYVHKQMIQQ